MDSVHHAAFYVLHPPYSEPPMLLSDSRDIGLCGRGRLLMCRPVSVCAWAPLAEFPTALACRPPSSPLVLWTDLLDRQAAARIHFKAKDLGARACLRTSAIDLEELRRQLTDEDELANQAAECLARACHIRGDRSVKLYAQIISLARHCRGVEELAAHLHLTRTTLSRRIQAGPLGPAGLLGVARLLHAANTIQRCPARPVEAVAEAFRYYDGAALRRQFRDKLGANATEIREHLGWEWILLMLVERAILHAVA